MREKILMMFRQADLRKKLFFTFLMLLVVRLGSQLPVPGIDRSYFSNWLASRGGGGALNFFSAMTGGSFERMSVFALNITPYITSSIIIELLTIAIPALEEMQRDGEGGRKKMTKISRYLTVGLSLFESTSMVIGFGRSGLFTDRTPIAYISAVVCMTAGAAVVMWIGENISEYGVGNGISIVLLINILSSLPQDLTTLFTQFVTGKTIAKGILAFVIIFAIILATLIFTILLNGAVRKIPIHYASKVSGRRAMYDQHSNLPVKVNTAGVIPVIFASSLLSIPSVVAAIAGLHPSGTAGKILSMLNQGSWFNLSDMLPTLGVILYLALILFFAYFYTSITFNPVEVADNLRKSAGQIPGIRPGKPTEKYLSKVLSGIIFIGAAGLSIAVLIPIVCNGFFHAGVSFGGTSLIIVASVILETAEQIDAQLLVRNYKGFLSE